MSPAGKDRSGGLGQFFRGGWKLFAAEKHEPQQPMAERRAGKRIALRLPAQACLPGGTFQDGTLLDVSPRGLALEAAAMAQAGQPVSVRMSSSVAGVPSFILNGQIVRLLPRTGIGVDVSKGVNGREALSSYRQLVLYYLYRRPLLDEVNTRSFEGRCTSCAWHGRVAAADPTCRASGHPVQRPTSDS